MPTSLSNPRFVFRTLCVGATALGLSLGAGWTTLRAFAHQGPPSAASAKAKPTPSVAPVEPPRTQEMKPGAFEADDWQHDEATQTGVCHNFKWRTEDMMVAGILLHYDDSVDKKMADADGSLVMDDQKRHITGDKAHILYGKKKLAVIDGNVVIVVKPDSDANAPAPQGAAAGTLNVAAVTPPPTVAGSDDSKIKLERGRGLTITCDHVEYYYGKKRKFAIIKGHVVFKQTVTKKNGSTVERTMTAEHAEYNIKDDSMLLYAPVEGNDTDGQKIKFVANVTVGTKSGAETLVSKGPVSGVIMQSGQEEDDTDDTANPGSPTKPAKDKQTPPPDSKNPPSNHKN